MIAIVSINPYVSRSAHIGGYLFNCEIEKPTTLAMDKIILPEIGHLVWEATR